MSVRSISISEIEIDSGIQARVVTSQVVVDEYAEAMREGTIFPPVIVYADGATNWLADGFQRVQAAKQNRLASINCEVRSGSRRDAMLCAAGANATHGLRRTNADKRLVVTWLLLDPEWSQWSDRAIARQCAVSDTFVGTVREELRKASSANEPQMGSEARTVKRKGTTYTQRLRVAQDAKPTEPAVDQSEPAVDQSQESPVTGASAGNTEADATAGATCKNCLRLERLVGSLQRQITQKKERIERLLTENKELKAKLRKAQEEAKSAKATARESRKMRYGDDSVYKRLAKKYHPDKNPTQGEVMKDINELWQSIQPK